MEVELDTTITPELLIEGNFNEFEHIIAQNLKKAGIKLSSILIPRKLVYDSLSQARRACLEDTKEYKTFFK